MSCLAAFACIFVFYGRRSARRSRAVPLAVMGFAAVRVALVCLFLLVTFARVESGPSVDRSRMRDDGLAELFNVNAWVEVLTIPLLVAAVIVDRRLIARVGA